MVCPLHFCDEASAAAPPGTPEKASAETDLCRGQHLQIKKKEKKGGKDFTKRTKFNNQGHSNPVKLG